MLVCKSLLIGHILVVHDICLALFLEISLSHIPCVESLLAIVTPHDEEYVKPNPLLSVLSGNISIELLQIFSLRKVSFLMSPPCWLFIGRSDIDIPPPLEILIGSILFTRFYEFQIRLIQINTLFSLVILTFFLGWGVESRRPGMWHFWGAA